VPWLSASGTGLNLTTGQLAGLVAGSIIYNAFCAAIGVAVGTWVSNQVGAVVALLFLLFLIDPTVSTLLPSVGRFGPGALGLSLSGVPNLDGPYASVLPLWAASACLAGYTALLLGAGIKAAQRREIA